MNINRRDFLKSLGTTTVAVPPKNSILDINPKRSKSTKKDLKLSLGHNSGGIIWGPEDAIYLDINLSAY